MLAAKQRDTAPERALRTELHKRGFRYRNDRRVIQGTRRSVDIAFIREKVAVFVDGCFWHGCPKHGTIAKVNREFWQNKIQENKLRDSDTNDRLRRQGWLSVRIWEHEDPARAAARIANVLRKRRTKPKQNQ